MPEIQSLARGLRILDLLSQAADGRSVTELADALNVDKASASRLVATLAQNGFTERDAKSRRYRLGPKVVTLGRSALERLPWRDTARPYLRSLMERTGECAHLAVAAQGRSLVVDQIESPASLRVNVQVGQASPLHCTALGKVLLAFGGVPIPRKSKLRALTASEMSWRASQLESPRTKACPTAGSFTSTRTVSTAESATSQRRSSTLKETS